MKDILRGILFTAFIMSAVMVDSDSNIPLIVCGVSFMLLLPLVWRKRRVKKYKY